MINPYKIFLDSFFENLLYFRHMSGRIDKVFQKEIIDYREDEAIIHFASALIISDWTGPTDSGWEINFPTGIITETVKENYESEVRRILSKQLCLLYAQSFEAFERFVKDCLFNRICHDDHIREFTISLLPKHEQLSFTRDKMPGGGNLFRVLKKAGRETYKEFTKKNNLNINFSELWAILSEARHSITHSESLIESGIFNKTKHNSEIFKFLFNLREMSPCLWLIELDYQKFERLMKRFSEFAYQIFKILSIEEGLPWKADK